jgi:hypothetical protein
MEQRAAYGPWKARPRLTVVTDGATTYSPLPHDLMRDTRLSRDARLLYAILQSHWWQSGECYASHATLAAEMGCSLSGIRRYLDELIRVDAIEERPAGPRRAKSYRPHPFRTDAPSSGHHNTSPMTHYPPPNTSSVEDCGPSNTSKPEVQYVTSGDSNTSPVADSYKKTPEKTLDEDLHPPGVDGDASAPPVAASDQAKILRSLSDGARDILDWHRRCHGRRRPAKLNPEAARVLEEAVADLGVERLRESVQYMAGKMVPELSKAIRAARTKRTQDEAPSAPSKPHRNGASPKPATSPTMSSWSTFKGRYGGNTVDKGAVDGC